MTLAPLTCATYETILRLCVIPGLGGKRLDRRQVRDVQTWINEVARSCQCCAQGEDTLDLAAGELSVGWQRTSVRRGGHRLAGLAAAVHHPLRNPGGAAQLQPVLGRPLRPFRGPEDHRARRRCATLLDLDVHPHAIMRVLRHAEVSATMDIYSQASSGTIRDTLKRLGESLR